MAQITNYPGTALLGILLSPDYDPRTCGAVWIVRMITKAVRAAFALTCYNLSAAPVYICCWDSLVCPRPFAALIPRGYIGREFVLSKYQLFDTQ